MKRFKTKALIASLPLVLSLATGCAESPGTEERVKYTGTSTRGGPIVQREIIQYPETTLTGRLAGGGVVRGDLAGSAVMLFEVPGRERLLEIRQGFVLGAEGASAAAWMDYARNHTVRITGYDKSQGFEATKACAEKYCIKFGSLLRTTQER